MIDFNEFRYSVLGSFWPGKKEAEQQERDFCEKIDACMHNSRQTKFDLGKLLVDLWKNHGFMFFSGGDPSCKSFFLFLSEKFDLDKSEVSRLMNVVSEFGYPLEKKYEKYSWAVLAEMLPLSAKDREKVKPEWRRKDVREFKRSLRENDVDQSSVDELDKLLADGRCSDQFASDDLEEDEDVAGDDESEEYRSCSRVMLIKLLDEKESLLAIRNDTIFSLEGKVAALRKQVAELEEKLSVYETEISDDEAEELEEWSALMCGKVP